MSDVGDLFLWKSSFELSELQIRDKFQWDDFSHKYQRQTGTKWSFHKTKTIDALQRCTKSHIIQAKTHYSSIEWVCELAGKSKSDRSKKIQCPAYINLKLNDQETHLYVNEYYEYHNHQQFLHAARWFRQQESSEKTDSSITQTTEEINKRNHSSLDNCNQDKTVEHKSKRNRLFLQLPQGNEHLSSVVQQTSPQLVSPILTSTEEFSSIDAADEPLVISDTDISLSDIRQVSCHNQLTDSATAELSFPTEEDIMTATVFVLPTHAKAQSDSGVDGDVLLIPKAIQDMSYEEVINGEELVEQMDSPTTSNLDGSIQEKLSSTNISTKPSVPDEIESIKKPSKRNKSTNTSKYQPISVKSMSIEKRQNWILNKLIEDYNWDLKPPITIHELAHLTGTTLSDVFVGQSSDELEELRHFFEEAAFEKLKELINEKQKELLITCPTCRLLLREVKGRYMQCCGCLLQYHYTCIFMKRRPKHDWFCSKCLSTSN